MPSASASPGSRETRVAGGSDLGGTKADFPTNAGLPAKVDRPAKAGRPKGPSHSAPETRADLGRLPELKPDLDPDRASKRSDPKPESGSWFDPKPPTDGS